MFFNSSSIESLIFQQKQRINNWNKAELVYLLMVVYFEVSVGRIVTVLRVRFGMLW